QVLNELGFGHGHAFIGGFSGSKRKPAKPLSQRQEMPETLSAVSFQPSAFGSRSSTIGAPHGRPNRSLTAGGRRLFLLLLAAPRQGGAENIPEAGAAVRGAIFGHGLLLFFDLARL